MKHTSQHLRTPSAALAAFVLALVALLAGCGSADHAAADVTFVQQMIPHHRQAVQMAATAATHDAGPEVRALASKIEAAQGPEIEKMTSWLRDWDEKVPSSSGTAGGSMGGMMSGADMDALDRARGDAFDRLFLTQMVEHHTGAVAMAKKEIADGRSADAVALARSIQESQSAEITRMKKLLAGL